MAKGSKKNHTPKISFRAPRELQNAVASRAAAEGLTPSDVYRSAVEQYVATTSHGQQAMV